MMNRRQSVFPKPPPQHLINHEDIKATEERLTRGPTADAWKKIGVKHHHGLCVPLFGLKTDDSCGIGEYGDLIPLADFCNTIKFDIIQLLPLHDNNTDNSPFSPMSSFALNPFLLSLSKLPHFDKSTQEMQSLVKQLRELNSKERVQWETVRELKSKWFALYIALPESEAIIKSSEYTAFLTANKYWIESYALFRTLKQKNSLAYWGDWPETAELDAEAEKKKLGSIQLTSGYAELVKKHASSVTYYTFLQYLCEKQLLSVKDYANSKGVYLKGDVPFLCSGDSADVWVHRNFFQTNMSAGAPGDLFNKDGQDWGLPLYNWPEIEKDDYTWWKERLRSASKYYQLFRIDHIVGFYRVWGVPKGKKASEGSYQPGDKNVWISNGEKILRVMLETTNMLPIGEDLGSIPKEVYLNLQKLGICGTRVLRWERAWERKEEGQPFIPIEDYIPDSMSTVSTHDSETLPLWWIQRADEAKAFSTSKHWTYRVLDLKGAPADKSQFSKLNGKHIPVDHLEDIMRDANTSASLFHISLLSEYLALFPQGHGDKHGLVYWNPILERVNVPGTLADSNWSYRMLPTIQTLIQHKDLQQAIGRTLVPASKVERAKAEKKPSVYVRQYLSKLPDTLRVLPGKSAPLGATWDGGGVNFAIFSENGTQAYLCLFDDPSSTKESHKILMPEYDDFVFHCYLPDIRPGQLYGFRVDGPWDPQNGLRFNANKVLLDPYAKVIGRDVIWDDTLFPYNMGSYNRDKDLEMNHDDNAAFCPLGAVVDPSFTWGSDHHPHTPWSETIIYEAHVKSISHTHPDIPEHIRGTYAALCSDPVIRHLKSLGVTAVELEPIHHHVDEKHLLDKGLKNYWGYNTLSFFAPDMRFCATPHVLGAVQEFKSMVRVLHSHGFEVILDVVYNHTAEGNHFGPMFSFKGADNLAYYKTVENDERYYFDYTGCGNSLNVRHPRVLQMIMDSLRYWILEMHVDGFRFDLASALARHFYEVDKLGAFFDIIHQDPVISRAKLIAEPWDVGSGGYQVGNFPVLWTEWNGRFRDSVRGFWNGKGITLAEMATRFTGSNDLYSVESGRSPLSSINFVTCHDGFNLVDLVSYNEKHNEANGENNGDGANDNISYNHGCEGQTDDMGITEFRWRQRANLMATNLLSLGVPMVLGGDELSMTAQGNNNTYCQDNELNWYNWDLDADAEDFLEFTTKLIHLRKHSAVLQRRRHLCGLRNGRRDISWFFPEGREPENHEWHDKGRQCLGYILDGEAINELARDGRQCKGETLLILLNAQFSDVKFQLPSPPVPHANKPWELYLSTDRALKTRVGQLQQPGDKFPLKDHSLTIFKMHSQRVRKGSKIQLAEVDTAFRVDSPQDYRRRSLVGTMVDSPQDYRRHSLVGALPGSPQTPNKQ